MKRNGLWFRVEGISFPRSGHKYITDLLLAYFGPKFNYCDQWPGPGAFPIDAHYLKNHDFDLDTPILDDRKYLVQVRDPFDSMSSWHKMTVPLDGIPDTRAEFARIFSEKLDYWSAFIRKWVLPEIPNRFILHYHDLITVPAESLARVVRLFGEEPNPVLIQSAVNAVTTIKRRQPNFYL